MPFPPTPFRLKGEELFVLPIPKDCHKVKLDMIRFTQIKASTKKCILQVGEHPIEYIPVNGGHIAGNITFYPNGNMNGQEMSVLPNTKIEIALTPIPAYEVRQGTHDLEGFLYLHYI